jgi:uncharacterized protein (DUF885 family)
MPSIDDIAAEYVERTAALDPFYATYAGIAGHDHELADLGADGFAGRAELDRSTLAALDAAEAREPRDQVARAAMRERLALAVECYDAGDTTSKLTTINSWVQMVRDGFDLMPTEGEEAAANIARRMAAVPRAYRQLSATLRHFLGAAVDLREAYAWSWEEIARLRAEMARVSNLVRPGATVEEAMAIPDEDPARRVEGRGNFRAWMQELAERTISELHGTHFDIPRPGRMRWSVPDGVEAFSTWKEVTVVYHEGVPGHHLQISHAMAQRESLNRWQRMSWVSGHGEGWALYAERLMGELGYLDDPGAYLGMLDSQQLLAVQVPLDIGVHLELDVPRGTGWREGERWNAEIAWELLRAHSSWDERQLRSELRRCLGMPGQAPSYKVGERIWLQAREDAMARAGAACSLKDFHAKALSLGAMGLDPLREALADV